MYCQKCGQKIENSTYFCTYCGAYIDKNAQQDVPSPGFAVLGFFIPLAGLILYLIYENKQPQKAKSAGKGALIGFIVKMIISVICAIIYVTSSFALLNKMFDVWNADESTVIDSQVGKLADEIDEMIGQFSDSEKEKSAEERTEELMEKYVDEYVEITFAAFHIQKERYHTDTSLEVIVKNKAESQNTYFITIEAVDENGVRLKTDIVYAYKLNPGQEIHLDAFKYVEQEKIEQYEKAAFHVLEIQRFDF